MRRSIPLLAALLACGPLARAASAQVMVAPTAVFVGERSPFGSYLVLNQTDVAQEVIVDFRFGLPVSNSDGETRMVYGDTLPQARWSANDWVRAFPRQFTLEPGEQQLVRVAIQPPADLTDGMYWTRIVTTSTPVSTPVDTVQTGVAAQIIFRLEQITTLLYRRGALTLAIAPPEPRVSVADSTVTVFVPLDHSGNSPFFGQTSVRILDEAGAVVAEDAETFAQYVDMLKRFDFARADLPAGSYTVEIRIAAERSDIPQADLIPMEPVTARVQFTIR